ncbi:MAG: Rieske 2Fe-2S domain-containing protein [Bacteroidota bacterium]
MSVSYTSVLWNKQKKRYDLALLSFVLLFLLLFTMLNVVLNPEITFETLIIRAFGLLALLLLHLILLIGPLSRINKQYLIVLYNRRHLGVTMFLMAAIHGVFSIMNFHSLGDMNPVRSVFLSNVAYNSFQDFPFQVLGFFALGILALMACTSHDFWLKNLSPKIWKALHMFVYVAYVLIILHVLLGALQNEVSPLIAAMIFTGLIAVSAAHVYAGVQENKASKNDHPADWVKVCTPEEIAEDRAKIVTLTDERIAIYKYEGKLSAVNNYCRHQGGPIGEGKIIDGCITCPWHGYQYLPGNGQSPPPFKEKLETYFLKIEDGMIWVNPIPNEPGTPVEPITLTK